MFNTAVPAGETLHVNISTDMTTEQAKELCDKDVIKITYGILDTYCMDTTTMGSFVTSAENSVYSGRQTSAALNNLYDSDFVKQMTKMCY